MSTEPSPFELTIPVEPADIDELGHVNNVAYLRWVQDVAVAHWKAIASAVDQAKLRWVVLRHEIDYKHPVYLGDGIVAKTWGGIADRIRFERHTELLRASDRYLLAKARTLWCPIDAATGGHRRSSLVALIRSRTLRRCREIHGASPAAARQQLAASILWGRRQEPPQTQALPSQLCSTTERRPI
jgi:acyl-CoA thioester hydrolase